MRVLVTGGTGYIGSHTVVELILAGHEVVIVDNLSNSKASVLGRIGEITGLTPDFEEADIRDERRLEAAISGAGFDACIHFAGLKLLKLICGFHFNFGLFFQKLAGVIGHRLQFI